MEAAGLPQSVSHAALHLSQLQEQYAKMTSQDVALELARAEWRKSMELFIAQQETMLTDVATNYRRVSAKQADLKHAPTFATHFADENERKTEIKIEPPSGTENNKRGKARYSEMWKRLTTHTNTSLPTLKRTTSNLEMSWSRTIVESSWFDMYTCCAILLCTGFNGWEIEVLVNDITQAEAVPFMEIQLVFSFLFFIELVLRISAYRCAFFFMEGWEWNWFDFALVALSVAEAFISFLGKGEGLGPNSRRMLRSVRVVRNLRVVRMARTQLFSELRKMLRAVFGSVKTLLWLVVLLSIILYFFALCLVSGVSGYLRDEDTSDTANRDLVYENFGSITRAMLSLFKAITNGVSWQDSMKPLESVSWWLCFLYLGYILFTVFAFMNAVTSVFVDNAMKAAEAEKDMLIRSQERNQTETLTDLKALFRQLDRDGSGQLILSEVQEYMKTGRATAYLRVLGIHAEECNTLFALLDANNNGKIDLEEFLLYCPRLIGGAKSIQIAELMSDIRRQHKLWQSFSELVITKLERLSSRSSLTCLPADATNERNGFSPTDAAHLQPQGDPTLQLEPLAAL